MDSWITQRIRAVSFRRVVVWTLALVGGVLLATSDRRYIANFMGGPYSLARADLDSIRDITSTPRYYARVAGDRVLDTGIRQYTVHTQSGVETSREESAAYHALVIGNHYLVVRTAGSESRKAEGKLVPWPEDLESQLFDSKEMRSLRSSFYPFYLDTDSFRQPGFVVIGVGIVFLLLFVWQAIPAWRAWRDPDGIRLPSASPNGAIRSAWRSRPSTTATIRCSGARPAGGSATSIWCGPAFSPSTCCDCRMCSGPTRRSRSTA